MSSTGNFLIDRKGHWASGPVPLFFVTFILLVTFVFPLYAACEDYYVQGLIKKALQMGLYKEKKWLKLLHYRPTLFGPRSVIDDSRFFLSRQGHKDPRAELVATLKGIFSEPEDPNKHPICRFPARFEWLRKRLSIDESRLPQVSCPELNEFLKAVSPEKAYLVFASYFMGSPASMYGHTFLIISPKGSRSKLLSYVANYAANATDRNGILYAFKGVFGFYRGYFTVMPYYEKIKQYSNMQHRDLWEYELKFSPDEVRFITLHLWELKDIYSYYYFFDENCSYQLLFLLDAVRPEAGLTDRFSLWVVPVDTIRWAKKAGLIKEPLFRPSKATLIKALRKGLERALIKDTIRVAEGDRSPEAILSSQNYGPTDKAKALELASELIELNYLKKKITKKQYQRRLLEVLKARTTLGTIETFSVQAPPKPEQGHDSSRLSISYGIHDDSGFSEFAFRPAYHDLYDPDKGYLPDSEIVFGEIRFRYEWKQETLHLQSFDLLSIQSLSVRDNIFKPKSWFVKAGYCRMDTPVGLKGLYDVNTGGGLTWAMPLLGTTFIMGQAEVLYGASLEPEYSLAVGLRAGFIKDISGILKLGLQLQGLTYEIGDRHRRYTAEATANIKILRDLSMRLSFLREKTFGNYHSEFKVMANVYL